MSLLENRSIDLPSPPALRIAHARLARPLYAMTLFVSALLLFSIQPMFAKLVLPKLGGAPAVWSVAMVFFQTVLLAGYTYAHLLSRMLPPRLTSMIHLALLGITAVSLPIAIAPGWGTPPADGTALWLFGLFAVSIGLPFFTLSASAPLLQSWFAASQFPKINPYVLYAASNLGSFAALLAYPTIVEPFLTLDMQARLWACGFAVLCLLMTALALQIGRTTPAAAPAVRSSDTASPSVPERLRWIALAAVPSGLVIAVTAYLTTDIAAAPFLWVVPLALYLLTFVAVFSESPWISHATVARIAPILVAPLVISIGGDKVFWAAAMALNLAAFFALALLCHGELYARRPEAARLTDFFLCTSFGGLVGGIFAGLLAPHLFSDSTEYPILIALAVLVLPGAFAGPLRASLREISAWVALCAALVVGRHLVGIQLPDTLDLPFLALSLGLVVAMMLQRHRPLRFFGLVAASLVLTAYWRPGMAPIETARSFFGVHRVVQTADGTARLLYHGNTIHGAQRLHNADGAPVTGAPEPLTHYYPGGPFFDGIASARAARGGFDRVAVVGLGTGSLACHAKDGERWSFYEIDPEVIRIAQNPERFEFLSRCAPNATIVSGDARLTLAATPEHYDLIVLDAFSSDAIPVHLLTREAFAGYLSRLTPHGVILVHISNRHLDLAPELANIAAAEQLTAFFTKDDRDDFKTTLRSGARLVMLARTDADAGPIAETWRRLQPDPSRTVWTDDYSNILGEMLRTKFGW
ncbi:fused MFS/spermidine synthase [Bradyrhizobium genosp. L]|uniref:fused MFS/spermidine synthase n=1 Tax=Bradyrhizobium genosp. L TaxID=83637 RepID=UPI0018A291A0|nr:fused MFS/spermidine synthase [Bradyrhizobium genosp. L]QPF87786.1 fused MFS/spermidine synthase [Bradyrhizobium genosp. L]